MKNAKKVLEKLTGKKISFGLLLKSIRTRDDLTQKELADILDVPVTHVSDLENNRKFVSVQRAVEFAKRLQDNAKYFVAVALQDQINQADLDYEVKIA